MTAQPERYHWSVQDYLRASEADAFHGRVELVDGEVWPVVIGPWHGRTTMRCAQLLAADGVIVTQESLVTGDSLPDPDVWVTRPDADEMQRLSPRAIRWHARDVLLVVEVSDETVQADLSVKTRLYGAAGYPVYWVVTPDAVFVHTEPDDAGYRTVVRHRAGDDLTLPYAERRVAVAELVGASSS